MSRHQHPHTSKLPAKLLRWLDRGLPQLLLVEDLRPSSKDAPPPERSALGVLSAETLAGAGCDSSRVWLLVLSSGAVGMLSCSRT